MVVDIDAFVFFFRFLLLPASVRCFGLTVYKEEGDVVVLATGKKLDTNMICVERFVGVNNGFVFRFGLVCLCSFAHWHFSRPTCVAEARPVLGSSHLVGGQAVEEVIISILTVLFLLRILT